MPDTQQPAERELEPAPRLEPATPAERVVVVDVLRGFAIFGILLVNMAFFSAPFYVTVMDTPWWTSASDGLVAGAIRLLAEGKFYPLFSFLFGLGMTIQMERIAARGGRFVRLFVRRLLVLLLIGLCHLTLLWYADILTTYALLGFLLLLFRARKNKTILIWTVAIYCLPVLVLGGCTALLETARLIPEAAPEIERSFAEQERAFVALAHQSAATYADGPVDELFAQRALDSKHILLATLFVAPGIFSMFLLGLYIGRRGVLQHPVAHEHLLRRLFVWGLPVGLLCNLGYTLSLEFGSRMVPTWKIFGGFVLYTAGAPLLTAGYAAGIVLLMRKEAWKRRLAPLAAVGRMALTNYLLQTLICTTLFYSYGLGLFGKVGPALGLALTVAIYLLQIPLSVWWLRRFRFGPMEWLWRSLTYARWQPMRLTPVREIAP